MFSLAYLYAYDYAYVVAKTSLKRLVWRVQFLPISIKNVCKFLRLDGAISSFDKTLKLGGLFTNLKVILSGRVQMDGLSLPDLQKN